MVISGRSGLTVVVAAVAALLGAGTARASGDLYGAIAVDPLGGSVGEAFDYPDQGGADQAALEACRKLLNPTKTYLSCTVVKPSFILDTICTSNAA
ncbi:DUF4189 domain-containing protein [Nocardia arthritidis]|uniref:DUF4189 domain-containing protein n=1 Tax=Nocardia arthritidis TaxID=228602 RepID=A0A6G9Y8I7_9NOCA|nr:DUF4189 domain-containing protein [Nocardia arthritidis]QIS09373.1 hypothetical protein F5544_07335 [Nocardia arthritidis]